MALAVYEMKALIKAGQGLSNHDAANLLAHYESEVKETAHLAERLWDANAELHDAKKLIRALLPFVPK